MDNQWGNFCNNFYILKREESNRMSSGALWIVLSYVYYYNIMISEINFSFIQLSMSSFTKFHLYSWISILIQTSELVRSQKSW